MTGNGGWGTAWGVEKVMFDSPAPKKGVRTSTREQVFSRDTGAKERIAALVAKLRKEPTKH